MALVGFIFEDYLPGHAVRFFGAVQVTTMACGNEVRSHILKEMRKPKSGNRYLVPGSKTKTYVASAPGEYPAVATGTLRTSIQVALYHSATTIMAIVGTTIWYGADLEYRPRNHGGRPWMSRGALETLPKLPALARRTFRREFRAGS